MKVAIIGSKAEDSMENNLKESFEYLGHEARIFDIIDLLLVNNKYSILIDKLLRHYSEFYDYRIFNKLSERIIEYNPDLVIGVYRFIHPHAVDIIKEECHCPVIHINPDQLTTFELQQVFASNYDVWFTKDPYIVRFMKDNMKLNAKLYCEAFNSHKHIKPNISKEEAERKAKIDVMTYGTIYPYRARMLKLVLDAGINLKIYGVIPHRFYKHSLDKAYQHKYIVGQEKADVLYGSKIVFNQMHYAEIESVNCRFFEVNGSGAFQLSDYRPILKDLLPIDPELVSFKGIDDGIDKIKYYLAHPKERYDLANKIYNYTSTRFSYENLVKFILSNI